MKDNEWIEDVGLGSFYNLQWEKREELVLDFIDRFVLHDNDKEEERRQKRRKKANGASLDSKAAKSLKSVMWGKVVEFTP
jgi:hypothetical protein